MVFVAVTQPMYNLTVEEAHIFFVGDGQWLVHNASCPSGEITPDGLQRTDPVPHRLDPLPGEKRGSLATGIYEFQRRDRGNKWYVGSATTQSLHQRIQQHILDGHLNEGDEVIWTLILEDGQGKTGRLVHVAERIRIEQVAEILGGRHNMANDPSANPIGWKNVLNSWKVGNRNYQPGGNPWPEWLYPVDKSWEP